MACLAEYHALTNILLTLRENKKKITKNFQLPKKSEKSRNITKVIKITKSGHAGSDSRSMCVTSPSTC
jgi:hypothetical protein